MHLKFMEIYAFFIFCYASPGGEPTKVNDNDNDNDNEKNFIAKQH